MSQGALPQQLLTSEPRRPALQQRVASAILEAAAHTLALRGSEASMTEVAAAAGVARATVYRYFPKRQVLLDELAEVAVADAGARLAAARLDEINAREAVARAIRALVEVGDALVVLARDRVRPDPAQFEQELAAPLRRIFERGQRNAEFRDDVPAGWLADALVGLIVGVLRSTPSLGREDTIAGLAALFLDGAGQRPSTTSMAG
jgi:TetR/AcrR family transcriptional repressor of mexCD-oprJ operon